MPEHYSTIRMTISWIDFGHGVQRFTGFCRFKVLLGNKAAGAKIAKTPAAYAFSKRQITKAPPSI
jgi:hypothetical protein